MRRLAFTRPTQHVLAAAVLLVLGGCRLCAEQVPCETANNCPLGFSCSANTCVVLADDAGVLGDAGRRDAGTDDAGTADGGGLDAGVADAGPGDAGPGDAGPADAGAVDAGPLGPLDAPLVLYRFEEGAGVQVSDTAGRGTPLHLTLDDTANVAWQAGALDFLGPAIARSEVRAAKVNDACAASGELSVEAWIAPDSDLLTGPARIVTVSATSQLRNFTLGVDSDAWVFRVRNEGAEVAGLNYLDLMVASDVVPGVRTHVVATYDHDGDGYRLYLDGALAGDKPSDGALTNWVPDYELALTDELDGNRSWTGRMEQVAVWCRALNAARVAARFAAGPEP